MLPSDDPFRVHRRPRIRHSVCVSHPLNALPNLPPSIGVASAFPMLDLAEHYRNIYSQPVIRVASSMSRSSSIFGSSHHTSTNNIYQPSTSRIQDRSQIKRSPVPGSDLRSRMTSSVPPRPFRELPQSSRLPSELPFHPQSKISVHSADVPSTSSLYSCLNTPTSSTSPFNVNMRNPKSERHKKRHLRASKVESNGEVNGQGHLSSTPSGNSTSIKEDIYERISRNNLENGQAFESMIDQPETTVDARKVNGHPSVRKEGKRNQEELGQGPAEYGRVCDYVVSTSNYNQDLLDRIDPYNSLGYSAISQKTSATKKRVRFRNRPEKTTGSFILDVYNPGKVDRQREEDLDSSRRLLNDVVGLEGVHESLRTYQMVANLRIGLKKIKLSKLEGIADILIRNNHKQQSLLQRPRKKPLQEYYNDDDAELEAMAKMVDPNAPKPEGSIVLPVRGEFPKEFQQNGSTPRSIDSVLQKHSQTQPKAVAAAILDQSGKMNMNINYGKLFSRAQKVAHLLTTKQISMANVNGQKEKVPLCRVGDCVGLVYPNTEPLAFLCAFYGCLLAGMVPVPVDVPTNRRDAGTQQFGFLLGSCGVSVVLTSESCYKTLPRMGSAAMSSATSAASAVSSGYATNTTSSGGSNGIVSPSASISGIGNNSNKDPNDIYEFKGWPKLHWIVTEHLQKPAKDFALPSFNSPEDTAYVEYSTDKEGGVKGVCVSRQSMIAHCRALTAVMGYTEGETMISLLDFKKDVGLWHLITAIYCGMKIVFVPYTLMKSNPSLWLTQVAKTKAAVVLLKSRDLHWSLMAAQRETKEINLESVRAIIVSDGSNPWSLSSCDQFSTVFASKGLQPNTICPTSGSPETGTVSIRRPSMGTGSNSGHGTLSMTALSHSVVRVNPQNSLNSLTLQDSGTVIPGGMAVVVKMNGAPKVCRTDEVGEICLHAPSTASCYYGLKGISSQTFQVNPLAPDEKVLGAIRYVRSGLVGFLGPDGLIFVIGNRQSIMNVSGKQYSADDLIATTLSVEPLKFIYRGRVAVFSVPVLRDERIIVIAEQKQDASEEDSFNWMIRVLQAVDSIHQVGIYCLILVAPNQLPKASLGGVHVAETRQRFLDGYLHPVTLLMCPQNCVLNLPRPREPQHNDVGPAAMFVGNIVQGVRIASAEGRALTMTPDEPFFLVDTLRLRAQQHPDHVLYGIVNAKGAEVETLTCSQLWRKAERIGALLLDKGHLNPGDHVALIFSPGLDLIAAFYGCLVVGLVPVCIRAPSLQNLHNSLITVRMVVDVSKSVALLSTAPMIKLLKSKEASHRVSTKAWPTILDINDTPSSSVARRKNQQIDQQLIALRSHKDPCFLDFAVSTTGQLAGVVITHEAIVQQCKSLKVACELYPSRHVVLCLDPYSGLGFTLWCLLGVYAGHRSTLIPPSEVELNPSLWLSTVSQHQARDTFCSYSILNVCVRELAAQVNILKEKNLSLSSLRNCVIVAEERPRYALCQAFIRLFRPLGLNGRAVSTSFGSRVNTAICLQGASSPDPTTVYVDSRALRNDRVTLVEKGAPHSIPLMECGKLLPGVKVVIANPETKGQCADSHLGEIWVASGHNASGYFSIFGDENQSHSDHFKAKLRTGDTNTVFARTGFLGFLRQTEAITADGELHDAVFVVGSLDETLMLRGMRYHPVDIETSVCRSHKRIVESAVFTWTHLLVVVAETDCSEAEALDLVPAITSRILEDQHLIVGVVMIVDAHTIPINSRGEKQRMHLRDSFLKDQLDPIYVAYNM
ncbi:unnamed protein product [Bursaphelenchus xylophilus]|uniref:(pine wood nematode) hypothetical protein n=1 Tax=Bursaphelenchus xylophilus TaxID=6326 RepID=A0A1I7RL73_BURXY|nr:unnamed protein product [Bursaphelenchus xylophilus]CAG9083360.1 unnamed protein product [Bursaphelenchus xylophilus]